MRIAIIMMTLSLVACGGGSGGGSGATNSTSGGDAPVDAVDLSTTSLVALRGQWGKAFFVECTGSPSGSAWGTDVYTDDSDPCAAAQHAGRVTAGTAGRVYGYIVPPLGHYEGTERNGVSSNSYGAWPGAFQFTRPDGVSFPSADVTVIGWDQSATGYRETPGAHRVWCPPQGVEATVWGTSPYSDDSSICTAAVHAGLITLASGGNVTVTTTGAARSFAGGAANGITTLEYGEFPGSFTVAH